MLPFVAVCVAVCCSVLQRVAAYCSAISHTRGGTKREEKRAGETGRECEGVTERKRYREKEIETGKGGEGRKGKKGEEMKERHEEREGDRDQSVACTRSIRTCSHKLYKSLFICQSLSATPTSLQQLTLVPAPSSRCTSSVSPLKAALTRHASFSCARECCSVLQCVAV